MERFNLNYSEKNIPIPSQHDYILMLETETESLIKRMRWKALAFQDKLPPSGKESYGFCPPEVNELRKFEEDLYTMIRNIEFRTVKCEFQNKQIPIGVGKRLSEVSTSEEIFNQSVPAYEEALKSSGFDTKLTYMSNENNDAQYEGRKNHRRNRRRKIIWYNPPYSTIVKTSIGKEFLRLISTHFHSQHVFHKIFNKNNVKISYSYPEPTNQSTSCMKNMSGNSSEYVSEHDDDVDFAC